MKDKVELLRLGAYVEVTAKTVSVVEGRKINGSLGSVPYRELVRVPYPDPVRGWVVGMGRRFEGVIRTPIYSTGYFDQSDGADTGHLEVSGSRLLYKVAFSYINKPVEVAAEDIREVVVATCDPIPIPMRATFKTFWSEAAKKELRDIMEKTARDAKGRWLK